MTDAEQVRAYAAADFAAPHDAFIAELSRRLPGLAPEGLAVDLGCGPGDVGMRFARAYPGWRVAGIDGSAAMIHEARARAAANGVEGRLTFSQVRLPAPPPALACDLVFSNSLLHHLHDPSVFWQSLIEWGRRTAFVFVMDLVRPDDADAARRLVAEHAGSEPEILRTDFYNSLLAAFEPAEILEQLDAAGLGGLEAAVISDRHQIVWGRLAAALQNSRPR